MWRGIVLGKLAGAILATIVVGAICFRQGSGADEWAESIRWYAAGVFFSLLGVGFVVSIFLLHYRKKS